MENINVIEFHQTRDLSKKMNATFEFVRQNFKPLTKSLLFIAGPPVLLASFFISNFYGKFLTASQQLPQNPQGGTSGLEDYFTGPGFFLEMGGIVIFGFLAGVFTVSVVNNYMKEYDEKKTNKIDVNDVWIRVRETFPMYLGTMILYMLALFFSYLIAIIPVVVLAALSPVLMVFGVIFIICAIFYIWVNLSVLFVVRANENIGFFESVSRSFYLVRDKFWSTFGLLFLTSMISGTIASIFFIPWYINFIVTMIHSMKDGSFQEPSMLTQLINNVFLLLYFLSSFILQALPLIAISFQYYNLVERKEAKGLMSRIETLGQQTPPRPKDEQH